MGNQLVPSQRGATTLEVSGARVSKGLARRLAEVRGDVILRDARVQGEAMVSVSKLHELDYVAYEAMSGQAMLHQWGCHLAGDDIIMADDLRFFRDMVKIGKGNVMADLVEQYRRI